MLLLLWEKERTLGTSEFALDQKGNFVEQRRFTELAADQLGNLVDNFQVTHPLLGGLQQACVTDSQRCMPAEALQHWHIHLAEGAFALAVEDRQHPDNLLAQ